MVAALVALGIRFSADKSALYTDLVKNELCRLGVSLARRFAVDERTVCRRIIVFVIL